MHSAWDPGLSSEIPSRLLKEVTLYRPESSSVNYKDAREAADFCGTKPQEMIAFTLERLILHELLIRVSADLSVPDGPNYEELGINLRGMAERIFEAHVMPEIDGLRVIFEEMRQTGRSILQGLIKEALDTSPPAIASPLGFWGRLRGKSEMRPPAPPDDMGLSHWQSQLGRQEDGAKLAALKALVKVVSGQIKTHGRVLGDPDLVVRLALNIYCNSHGPLVLREALDPLIKEAARLEKYRVLPAQDKPFFMNVKGASAAGKSTIRPEQRALAEKLNIPWEDFALISPDYWRKSLLDYESMGEDYKYAAMLTGQELEIIDKKLDAYMEQKAGRQAMPHLLIDRFRFDSFATDQTGNRASRLLTRFGDTIFLFFMVTPPSATVERAWTRGLSTGRFKAVDDLLYHNIEAYEGMPELFFSWVLNSQKNIHFEFLDNSVALGERPLTIAYGWNDEMVVLDREGLDNIDRFRAVNIEATRPEDVLKASPELTFVNRCVESLARVTLLDPKSLEITQKAENGAWVANQKGAKMPRETAKHDQSFTLGRWS